MIPVVVLGIVGGSFLAFRALRPIRSLIQTVRSVSTGRMDSRVPTLHTSDELDELVMLFNSMLEKIEALISGMRGSLDNVAHTLFDLTNCQIEFSIWIGLFAAHKTDVLHHDLSLQK